MPDELRYEIRRVTLGRAWVSDATLAVIASELDSGERVVAALTNSGSGNTLFATSRRVIVANERNIAYECPHDAITEVEAKTGFLTQGVNLRSAKRAYLYRTGSDKEGPVEMAAAIRRLMAESALADDDNDAEDAGDATEIAVAIERASAIGRLADVYIGVATPSRAEVSALPGLLAEGERVALIANCRREWDYGALVATDTRAMFVSEGEDGAVVTASWPHDLVDRVEIGAARRSLSYAQLHTADGVVQIDALDIVVAESWPHDLTECVARGSLDYIQMHTDNGAVQINPFDVDIKILATETESWLQDLIERVEQGVVRGSLAYIQLHTADGVVRLDAFDIDAAQQATEFLRSKMDAAAGAAAQHKLADADKGKDAPTAELADQRELEDADKGDGALTGEQAAGAGENQDSLTSEQVAGAGDGTGGDDGTAAGASENKSALTSEQAAQLQSIEALRDSGILTAEEFERMRARIYEKEAERAAQLQSIEALRDSGILTAEEFDRMRARIYEMG